MYENKRKFGKLAMFIIKDEHVRNEHAHFHPSGNLNPSMEDTRLTDRIIKLTQLMGIPLLDHIIVGGDNHQFFSFKEKDMMQNQYVPLATNYQTLEFGTSALVAEEPKSKGKGR